MELKSFKIINYRSIEEIEFDIFELNDKSYTFGLIGVNEAGKSTILKALALKDGIKDNVGNLLPLKKDFKISSAPIEIQYSYILNKDIIDQCQVLLNAQTEPIAVTKNDLKNVIFSVIFEYAVSSPLYKINLTNITDDNKEVVQNLLMSIIEKNTHRSVFWTAEDRYLISQPIDIVQFSAAPDEISVPLKNCFSLAGMKNFQSIKSRLDLAIADSTEREKLRNDLGEKVTEHIKNAWPKHPIKITFDISDGFINFHVNDIDSKGKAKTADQRSDGFRQFVSFLLTISAESKNEELSNTILLLDEPETHLHPQAQEDLLRELVRITSNNRNNISFFATHSNYMIDKNDLSRNYKIVKDIENTTKTRFDKKTSTYASVTYEVFGIDSMDYHNELYDNLREKYSMKINKDNVCIMEFDNGFLMQEKNLKLSFPNKGKPNKVTLPTFVRNAIHYPANKDKKFDENLKNSIETLNSYDI